ncbi:unnamed protein product, partial [Didymodactylos carnosus]
NDTIRSLWAGTNGGHVYVYSIVGGDIQLTSSISQRPSNTPVGGIDQYGTCSMVKEIRLKHKAPVLSIVILDGLNRPVGHGSGIPAVESSLSNQILPTTSTSQSATTTMASEHTTNSTTFTSTSFTAHKVLICSEEQFKIFTLPNLKPLCKYKLTATEGARVRKISVNQFTLKTDIDQQTSYSESCLLCLSNLGEISIYSLPSLRRQAVFSCIKTGDITALSSVQFTPCSHAFYLQSSSELAEVSFTPVSSYPYSMSLPFNKSLRKLIQRSSETSQTFLPISTNEDNKKKQQSPANTEERYNEDNKIKSTYSKQNITESPSSPKSLTLDNTNDSTLTSASETHQHHHSSTVSPLSKSSGSSSSQKITENNLSNTHNHNHNHHEKEQLLKKQGMDNVIGNNSSTNSDSAIDLSSGGTSINTTTNKTNSSDENHGTVYKYNVKSAERELSPFQSTPLKISNDVPSSMYNGHSIATSSISPVEKQQVSPTSSIPSHSSSTATKLISVKVRQAPTINEIHCNGTKIDHQIPQLSSPQRTSAPIAPSKPIHT